MADEDKDRLIAQIMDTQRRMQYLFAHDRSNPLFDAHLTMPQLKILLMLAAGDGASGQELQRFMGVSLATVTGSWTGWSPTIWWSDMRTPTTGGYAG